MSASLLPSLASTTVAVDGIVKAFSATSNVASSAKSPAPLAVMDLKMATALSLALNSAKLQVNGPFLKALAPLLATSTAMEGTPVIATASLCERDAPYLLAVELARGKIGQVRNEAASWQESGLLLSDEFQELSRNQRSERQQRLKQRLIAK